MIKITVKGPKAMVRGPASFQLEPAAQRVADFAMDSAEKTAARLNSNLRQAVSQSDDVETDRESSSSIREDADHLKFVAEERPQSLVGAVQVAEAEVHVEDQPMPSGRPADLVARTIEFGSQTLGVPATAFAEATMWSRKSETQKDAEQLLRSLDAGR